MSPIGFEPNGLGAVGALKMNALAAVHGSTALATNKF